MYVYHDVNVASLVERKMPNAMNVNRLITEVQKRPALWDLKKGESKSRYCAPNLWKEVANAVGTDGELN